ncbi:hypothetical protein IAR55_000544 [Kwoniella newhampshirensis]|uniref:Ubiquilin n=1 Tax=Kwoniella newhampshirensis TaxID=1651941 RepID=A0AAW0Z735_9TREE
MTADESASSGSDINITVKGPSELKLALSISPEKSVAELKELIASKSDVEKDRQRLIYSGKVLKDEDPISNYKIQNGHTIHMVKGASRGAAAASSTATNTGGSSSTSAGIPRLPQMGTGLNVGSNPIDNVENIHHGLAGFNPFAGMQGMDNLNDPNAMANMMQNPEFLRSMSDLMSRPEVVDQIISSNPQLAAMGPQVRQMMSSPFFRQMISNPESLRMMMQMQSAMGGQGGMGGMGGMGGLNPFGAAPGAAGDAGTAGSPPTDPFPNLFAPNAGATPSAGTAPGAGATPASPPNTAQPPPNPFAALFGGAGAGAGGPGGAGANPFGGFDPATLFGAGGLGGGLGGGGWGAPPPPADSRPPEEIYATQLGQLNGMGLWDAAKNIRALRRTGGNVEAAIELIFSGQLDQ